MKLVDGCQPMETTDQTRKMEQLFHIASNKLSQAVSLNEAEPEMVTLLREIKSNQGLRPFVVEMFKKSLSAPHCPWELIQFCMHDLRWPEMREWIEERRLAAKSIDDATYWRKLTDAFEDDWEDAEFYSTFQRHP